MPKAARLVLITADMINAVGLPDGECENRVTAAIVRKYRRFWHHLHHTWIVGTDDTVEEVSDFVLPVLGAERPLLVTLIAEVGHPMVARGWLPKEAWSWLREQMPGERR